MWNQKEIKSTGVHSKPQRWNCTQVGSICCMSAVAPTPFGEKEVQNCWSLWKITNPKSLGKQHLFLTMRKYFDSWEWYCLAGFTTAGSYGRKNSPGKGPCSIYLLAPIQLHCILELVTPPTVAALQLLFTCDVSSFSPNTHMWKHLYSLKDQAATITKVGYIKRKKYWIP